MGFRRSRINEKCMGCILSKYRCKLILIQGVIFVIDSTDIDCLEESKNEFYKILKNEELKNSIVLIYANKQDIPNSKNVADLIQIYNFDKIKTHMWHIQPCSAKTGEGLMAGMKWLSDQLIYKKNTRFPNNPYLIESYYIFI
jgi:signal recognition particle receptor subunit beta